MPKRPERVGERIRRLRLAREITQTDLARRIGVKPPSLCDWENGNAQPMVRHVEAAAKALGLTMAEFYGESDAKVAG